MVESSDVSIVVDAQDCPPLPGLYGIVDRVSDVHFRVAVLHALISVTVGAKPRHDALSLSFSRRPQHDMECGKVHI
jgi:hypothetical protein